MTRDQLEHTIRAAGAICEDRELYVVGSQSILGPFPEAHPELRRSMEVDIAPKNRPELEALIEGSIGELSPFHQTFGYYVDGVEMNGITLPAGWSERLVRIENTNTNGYCGLCLNPADLAVSKLAAQRPKDLDFVRILLRERLVSAPELAHRLAITSSFKPARQTELTAIVQQLAGS